MTKPPKLLEKTSSGHSRRPSGSRRTSSSSDRALSNSSSNSSRVKGSVSHAPTAKIPPTMSALAAGDAGAGSDELDRGEEHEPVMARLGSTVKTRDYTHRADDGGTDVRIRQDDKSRLLGESDDGAPGRMWVKGGNVKNPAEELDRLRAEINTQISLSQQRGRLTKNPSGRETEGNRADTVDSGRTRASQMRQDVKLSPSIEDAFASPLPSTSATTSTESAKTVRGTTTPSAFGSRTPSYPFPPMRTPRQLSSGGHRPFMALSPTVPPENFHRDTADIPQDRLTSGSVTPASAMMFQPEESPVARENPLYPSPNLYDLSLMLSAEPGLDAWWSTVVEVMRDIYKADRVTLAVPADSTDSENVPWGQKATFSAVDEDRLSLTYLPRGSSLVPSSTGETNFTSNSGSISSYITSESYVRGLRSRQPERPGLQARHSFTAYEETKRGPLPQAEGGRATALRPSPTPRSKSYFNPGSEKPPRTVTLQNAGIGLQSLQDSVRLEEEMNSTSWGTVDIPKVDVRGRVLPVLQALDYEPDCLIDSSGVTRVLERGKLIALTRDYPYLQGPEAITGGETKSISMSRMKDTPVKKTKRSKAPEVIPRISNMFGGTPQNLQRSGRASRGSASDKTKRTHEIPEREDSEPAPSPRYEEYEQAPPSPWSQSPVPSPAICSEPAENPFFAIAEVDEDSFNPAGAVTDYSNVQQVNTIGIDRSCTVLHIPLNHPILSKPVQSFRLDAAVMESKTAQRSKEKSREFIGTTRSQGKGASQGQEKRIPVAILSIISPVIPYPSNLRHSLEDLSPHLATTFSLCQHYTNLETEIAGLQRKRPRISGFGAVARPPDARMNQANAASFPSDDEPRQRSAGSITSPSDYSAFSRSTAGSPSGTPGWEPNGIGSAIDRQPAGGSPGFAPTAGDGYFGSKVRTTGGKAELNPDVSAYGGSRSSKDTSPIDSRYPRRSRFEEVPPHERISPSGDRREVTEARKIKLEGEVDRDDQPTTMLQPKQVRIDRIPRRITSELLEARELSPSRSNAEAGGSTLRQALHGAPAPGLARTDYAHTKLHTGGVDFGTTFPSLPSTFDPESEPVEMLPPSDRLKTLMLDTLPCHVFVALPVTGEIVWVNSRYLTYRGQTIPQLREDPWGSLHPDEREGYLKAWSDSIRTGQPFSKQVRIRRFDGAYRWFFTRAVAGKDTKNVIVQWYGSHMDIHDQHVAEVKAARQEESEASEANYRLLANLIPQIIFAASEESGVIFANEQWLSYTGQEHQDALQLGFMDYVHPEDLAKCRIPSGSSSSIPQDKNTARRRSGLQSASGDKSPSTEKKASVNLSETPTEVLAQAKEPALSRTSSSGSESRYDFSTTNLTALARSGVVQVSVGSDGRQSYTTEVRLRSKSGEYRWHLVRCVEVDNFKFGDKGSSSGSGSWFGACTDINDHKLLETKLKEAMDSKSKFLSNMSHEIRTPLIGISGMVSFLQDTPLNEEQLDYTNTIQTSANSLLSIINDILDLSKVDAGMMRLSYEWFHARSVIEEVNELVSTMAISKRLELNYVVDEDVPAMIKGDKVRIRQVLLNVIGNAIKFTTEGEVFSRCKVYYDESLQVGNDEIMLEFSVVDTGRGFTKEEAELIFKPFSQIDGSSTRQHGGSGLGLVISRQLVELHGGKMVGTAVPRTGSTFKFTAKFGLPTEIDHPSAAPSPVLSKTTSFRSTTSAETSNQALKLIGGDQILSHRLLTSPSPLTPKTDPSIGSSVTASSASSDPSIHSSRTFNTDKSSRSSFNQGLANFSEAARASGQDLLGMKLVLPGNDSSDTTPTQGSISPTRVGDASLLSGPKSFHPPIYSILVVCPQTHSREAATKHIEQTLPKDVPSQITPSASVMESQRMIGGDDPVIFTHIVLNLSSPEEIIALMDQIFTSTFLPMTSVVILSDPVQRQTVMKLAPNYEYDQLAQSNRLLFIFKPVKPSRFAFIFDPDKERDLSTDRNRSNAQQQVANQKQNYLDVEARLGNKGHRVLLVEDNLVNQKVLLKYLSKVGIDVEVALDGVECTDKVFAQPHEYYSLILCDLHMPRKDGYQTCRDIRAWEKRDRYPLMPIIALSANVMAEVIENCIAAGFNSYVTKPVDFKQLSSEMAKFLDRENPQKPHELMRSRT